MNSKERPTNRHQAAAYLELRPVLEVVVPRQAGVELHPVARNPGGDLAGATSELGVAQEGGALIDIMPSALQSASAWKERFFILEIFSMKGHWKKCEAI